MNIFSKNKKQTKKTNEEANKGAKMKSTNKKLPTHKWEPPKNKDKNKSNNKKGTVTYYHGRKPKKDIPKPKTNLYTSRDIAVLFITKDILNGIWEKVKDVVSYCEFQIHYHSVTFKCTKKDEFVAYVVVPTVFYNFPQKVSSSYIGYNLPDIKEAADKVKHIHDENLKYMYLIQKHLELLEIFDEVTPMSVFDNSLHRHPDKFSFSATDMDNNPEEPGVIFRKRKASSYPQMDSVMYFGGTGGTIVTSEMRIVDVEPDKDGIKGEYVEVPTVTILGDNKPKKGAEAFFGKTGPSIIHSDVCGVEYDLKILEPIHDTLSKIPWGVFSEVDASVIHRDIRPYKKKEYGKGKKQPDNLYGDDWDDWEDWDYWNTWYEYLNAMTEPDSNNDHFSKKQGGLNMEDDDGDAILVVETMYGTTQLTREDRDAMVSMGLDPANTVDVETYEDWRRFRV